MTARVLLIDDEAAVVETLAYNLSRAGFHVLTAADGLEALKQAQAGHPDIIIPDLLRCDSVARGSCPRAHVAR